MKSYQRAALSCSLLIATLSFLWSRSYGEAVPIRQPLAVFPQVVGEWQGQETVPMEESVLGILKLTDYVMRRYADPSGHSLWLYIGYWETQQRGAQIHSPKHCLPGGGWEPLEAKQVAIPLPGQTTPLTANFYLIQKDHYQQVVLYWYQSQGRAIAGEIQAKLQLIKGTILHNRTDAALVRLISPVNGSVQDTFARQKAYVQAMAPMLGLFLPE
jgi:EpsI family protein